MARIAICFFGMNRSLSLTHKSIIENIIKFNSKKHNLFVYGALNVPNHQFSNNRSDEFSCIVENNFQEILKPVSLEFIPQEAFDQAIIDKIYATFFNDTYGDNFQSIMNIARELFSVKRVFMLAENNKFDYYLFVRPDLYYCNSFNLDNYIIEMETDLRPRVFTPFWQKWSGLNDRFAFCNSIGAQIFSQRYDMLWNFCDSVNESIHAERLLLYTMIKLGAEFDKQLSEFAIRVRATGKILAEEYGECGSYYPTIELWKNFLIT